VIRKIQDKKKRVIVALPYERVPGRAKMRGVLRYINTHEDWDLLSISSDAEFSSRKTIAALQEGIDGMLLSIPCSNSTIARKIAAAPFPIVSMDVHDPIIVSRPRQITFISNASEDLGEAAAGHLCAMGTFQSYAYVADNKSSPWAQLRGKAFASALGKRGLGCSTFGTDRQTDDASLLSFLRGLPKPTAVFAASDLRAKELLSACKHLRLKIPSKVAILGVDDDDLICENTTPTLSSIRPDYEEEGYAAAAALAQMLSGQNPPRTILAGVKFVVRRESTTPDTRAGALIRRAIEFIDQNARSNLTVNDVVRHLKVSRRLADLRFRQVQCETIQETITNRKLEEVQKMLSTTLLPIETITEECGFQNANHLKNLFKRKFGLNMRDYRKTRLRDQRY